MPRKLFTPREERLLAVAIDHRVPIRALAEALAVSPQCLYKRLRTAGRPPYGKRGPTGKTQRNQELRERRAAGATLGMLAREYGISRQRVAQLTQER